MAHTTPSPGVFASGTPDAQLNKPTAATWRVPGISRRSSGAPPTNLLPRVSSHDRPPRSVMVELPTKCRFSCHERQQALPWLTGRLMRREPDVEAPALAIAPSSFAPPPTEDRGGSDNGYAAPPSHRAAAPPCRTPVRHQSAEARTTARPAGGRLTGGPLGKARPAFSDVKCGVKTSSTATRPPHGMWSSRGACYAQRAQLDGFI